MMRRNKKGFTIVELVIVIAVIAILAAVLIPTFSGLIKKAQISADTQLCRNINNALAMQADGKNATMSDAMRDIEESGYTVDRLTPTTEGYMICWDQSSDRVVLLKEDKKVYYSEEQNEGAQPDVDKLWMIVHNETELKANKDDFSIYLADDYGAVNKIEVSKGFDCGENNVANVVLTNGTSTASYILNTVGSNVTIKMPNATINHYGNAANVVVEEIAGQSYHAHGNISVLEVQSGRAVVESTGTVTNVIVSPVVDTMTDTAVTLKGVEVKVNGKVSYQTVSNKKVEKHIDEKAAPENKESLKTAAQAKVDAVKTVVDAAMPEGATEMAASVITTAEELKTALASTVAQFITLGGTTEFVLTETAILKADIVLDLNGQTISSTTGKTLNVMDGGNLIINDSSATQTGTIKNDKSIAIAIDSTTDKSSSCTLNAGTITADYGVYVAGNVGAIGGETRESFNSRMIVNGGYILGIKTCGIFVIGEGADLTVNNGIIEMRKDIEQAAISGNGAAIYGGTLITINGGEIKSEKDVAIYHPQRGVMNINGGTIWGKTGIQMKAGHLYVKGGKIRATESAPSKKLTDSSNGCVAGAASAILIGSNSAYAGDMIVDITGGEFISEHYYAIHELIPENPATGKRVSATDYVNYIKIVGGTYTSGTGYANIYIEYAFGKITTSGVSATIEYGSKAQ